MDTGPETRRVLHTGADLPTDCQIDRLNRMFAENKHVEVETTLDNYQRIIDAYRIPSREAGKKQLQTVITALTRGGRKELEELISLGRTLKRCGEDVLAYFDRPGTGSGPTEVINGRLEHLRGTAL